MKNFFLLMIVCVGMLVSCSEEEKEKELTITLTGSESLSSLLPSVEDVKSLTITGLMTEDDLVYLKSLLKKDESVEILDISNTPLLSIMPSAFGGCGNLTTILIPETVMAIEQAAFDCCTNLVSVNIPNNVKYIADLAFYNCTSLASISLPNGLESIGKLAFNGCEGLTTVTIPGTVTFIGDNVFDRCINLTSMHIRAVEPPEATTFFSGTWDAGSYNRCVLYVPRGTAEDYKNSEGWYRFTQIMEE